MSIPVRPAAVRGYLSGLLKGEDHLHLIASWGQTPVLQFLQWHKVEPIARELHLASPSPLPGFAPLFRNERLRHLLQEEVIRRQFQEIAAAFAAQSQEFLVLKGFFWGEQIYPSSLWRHLGDIDLLVRPETRTQAVAALLRLGYKPYCHSLEEYLNHQGEVVLAPADENTGRTLVELHWSPINVDRSRVSRFRRHFAVDPEDFFTWAAPAPWRNLALILPRPEVMWGYQVVHGVCQHQLKRFLPLVDLAYLFKRNPGFDFPFLVELMRKWRATIPLYIALTALKLFGFAPTGHREILAGLEQTIPLRIRLLITATLPRCILSSHAGRGVMARKLLRRIIAKPLEMVL